MDPDHSFERRQAVTCVLFIVGFVVLYHRILLKLIQDWSTDDNYSHGFLVAPIAAYLIWQRRGALRTAVPAPRNYGLGIVLGSLFVLVAGVLGSELFLSRISMIGVL